MSSAETLFAWYETKMGIKNAHRHTRTEQETKAQLLTSARRLHTTRPLYQTNTKSKCLPNVSSFRPSLFITFYGNTLNHFPLRGEGQGLKVENIVHITSHFLASHAPREIQDQIMNIV
jgi:hypothetical protein